ncbi:insulinase family protein [Loktanella sp. IMCC34160]|uniref:M16 family metallopeptidase n=1 Tax=Loktanella sp. IMCC34160 TaxID=2510646 RepID=UPI00101B9019|nr:pitrilysin family protein [Loktanella sp. IMCC34160]RYG91213.1 insulinase family protein [Loktanella sp. IMCC34160]
MRRLIAALCLAAAPLAATGEEVTTFTLDNGMDVVVIEDHRAPVVVHMVWYRSGSADEPPGSSGVAHFLEHLLFKATDTMESGELSEVVAANGGSDNAFTSYDYTAYFQRVAADRLELMMRMEADRMNNLRLTEEDIVTERNVILEERNQRTENNAGALAREQLRAAQYLNHRYGLPIIGWKHEMESLDMQDALSFYDLYYSPNNAILVVAGDVEPQEVLTLAETYYGVIPPEEHLPERFRPEEPPQTAERRLTYVDPRVSQPYLTRSYLAPERDAGAQEDAAALVYLSELLGGSPFTSALGVALQFDSQTAVYSGAGYDAMSLDDTTFNVTVVPAEGVTLSEAEAAMDQVIADFLANPIDLDQMERIRTQLRASEIYALDDVEGIARRYGAALTQGLTIEDVQAWPGILQAVSAEDVKAVAEKVLQRRQSVTGWIVPSEEEAL